mgnify:CR=1 FL=1
MSFRETLLRSAVVSGKLCRRHTTLFPGEIIVREGQEVRLGEPLAYGRPCGRVCVENISRLTKFPAARITEALLFRAEEIVSVGEILVRGRRGLLGGRDWIAPWNGVISHASPTTGLVFFAEQSDPVPLCSRLRGTVVEVRDDNSVVVEGYGSAIAGALGQGGIGFGNILMADGSIPPRNLMRDACDEPLIVFTESLKAAWLASLPDQHIAGVIAPSITPTEIESITGKSTNWLDLQEVLGGYPLLITEGIGSAKMPAVLQRRLREHEALPASLRGSLGPGGSEILLVEPNLGDDDGEREELHLRIGGGRFLGSEVVLLSNQVSVQRTESGQIASQLEVRSADRGQHYVPALNLEMLE